MENKNIHFVFILCKMCAILYVWGCLIMKDMCLINYSVKGIKTLDQLVSLSFYKKTITKSFDMQEYNLKGIYGMNGSGKSAIVTSVDILKNLLINPLYLSNPIVQKNLNENVNKRLGELYIEIEYIADLVSVLMLYRYSIRLSKDKTGKFVISYEQLSSKPATSRKKSMQTIFRVVNGEIEFINGEQNDELVAVIMKKTTNLLNATSMSALFYEKIFDLIFNKSENYARGLFVSMFSLFVFGKKLHVYIDQSDDHRDYLVKKALDYPENEENNNAEIYTLMKHFFEMDSDHLNVVLGAGNVVSKKEYKRFEKTVDKLYEFLHIFKYDLKKIEIDKKEDQDAFVCNLIMVYDSYKIDAEFESTGIKKLIKLFVYLKEMVKGGIVFIDEFDSNLHDVYLCALLEYLMEYGEGQLCFTTHNVGPMDILRQGKKSIDFLSVDHKIYPWSTNGNYSPAKLYRNGMIEGSPFNVDSIDFISALSVSEEDA